MAKVAEDTNLESFFLFFFKKKLIVTCEKLWGLVGLFNGFVTLERAGISFFFFLGGGGGGGGFFFLKNTKILISLH